MWTSEEFRPEVGHGEIDTGTFLCAIARIGSPVAGAAAGTVMRRWCETDSVAASEWLQTNRNSAAYTPAVVALVNSIRADNPAGARAWAETIPDTELRAQVLSSLPGAP